MSFHVLGAGVLGLCPGVPPQQAYFAGSPSLVPGGTMNPSAIAPPHAPPPDVWNNQVLLAALATSGVPPSGPQAFEWFLDPGATSHMAANVGNFASSQPLTYSAPIAVGNGALLLVTHRASTAIATPRSALHLNNILISPSLVRNLIFVQALTRDNNVIIEFDPHGFPIKDIPTRTVLL